MEFTDTTTATPNVLRVAGYVVANYLGHGQDYELTDQPSHVDVSIRTAPVHIPADPDRLAGASGREILQAAGQELVDLFPKSVRFRACFGPTEPAADGDGFMGTGEARTHVRLAADGTNGGVNESGIKRLRTIVRTARKLGLTIEFPRYRVVNPMTPDQFFAMIGEPAEV